eukprot:1892717-Rhodomonas_salina.1
MEKKAVLVLHTRRLLEQGFRLCSDHVRLTDLFSHSLCSVHLTVQLTDLFSHHLRSAHVIAEPSRDPLQCHVTRLRLALEIGSRQPELGARASLALAETRVES